MLVFVVVYMGTKFHKYRYIFQAETSALKDIPVVVMSSENDSARIKRYRCFTPLDYVLDISFGRSLLRAQYSIFVDL